MIDSEGLPFVAKTISYALCMQKDTTATVLPPDISIYLCTVIYILHDLWSYSPPTATYAADIAMPNSLSHIEKKKTVWGAL